MKRDFSVVLNDLDGRPLTRGLTVQGFGRALDTIKDEIPVSSLEKFKAALEKEMGEPLTLNAVCVSALLAQYDDERGLADEERIARMVLAEKIHKGGIVDIEPTERDKIKPLIKKAWNGVMIPVLAWRMLETDA